MRSLFLFSELIMVSAIAYAQKKDISNSVKFITMKKSDVSTCRAYATGTKDIKI